MRFSRAPCQAYLGGLPRGVHLVRYGGGGEFRQSTCLLSLAGRASSTSEASLALVEAAKSSIAASKSGYFAYEELDLTTIVWEALEVDVSVTISTKVRGGGALSDKEKGRVNMFFHGWLFDDAFFESMTYASQLFPLVGVLQSQGCFKDDEGDEGNALGTVPSAPFDGTLLPMEQHVHKEDPFGGSDREAYKQLLISESNPTMSEQDAEEFVMMQEMTCQEYLLGSDSARVCLKTTAAATATTAVAAAESSGSGAALVACLDLSDVAKPRLLVTLLFVILGAEDEARAKQVIAESMHASDEFTYTHIKENVLLALETTRTLCRQEAKADSCISNFERFLVMA